jgi:hypothetical protein
MRNRGGTDRVLVRSVNKRTGEVCKGSASIELLALAAGG